VSPYLLDFFLDPKQEDMMRVEVDRYEEIDMKESRGGSSLGLQRSNIKYEIL
jgi:hypothetical protein